MAQHDYSLANASGASFRADANSALSAIVTWNSGTAPATTFARMRWADTSTGTVKRRNAANTGWIIESTDDETRVMARSSNTALDPSDFGKLVRATSTFTQTFNACATLADGWWIDYVNEGSGDITLDPNLSETIDGATTLVLKPGASCRIVCNGTNLKTVHISGASRRQIFTSSGSWNKPGGVKRIRVTVVGGGGGGGQAGATGAGAHGSAGGGGAGGTAIKTIEAGSLGSSETVTVGAGGAATVAGGNSSFGAHCTGNGGAAGTGTSTGTGNTALHTASGSGGTATGGDLNIPGEGGGFGFSTNITANHGRGGRGGNSTLGAGGKETAQNTAGNAATGYGSGGSGACTGSGSAAINGGAGVAGVVIVDEFF